MSILLSLLLTGTTSNIEPTGEGLLTYNTEPTAEGLLTFHLDLLWHDIIYKLPNFFIVLANNKNINLKTPHNNYQRKQCL